MTETTTNKLAIMQPYFLPYIGYFQLINAVDKFVIYDNIQFSKKGWINRNRILMNGKDHMISLPLKKDSDYLNVDERYISDIFEKEKNKLIGKIKNAYLKAPEFKDVFPFIQEILNYEEKNLFSYILNSLQEICKYLEIETEFIVSSTVEIDHSLRGQEKVIALCNKLNATCYINTIGGVDLYSKKNFKQKNTQLNFIESKSIEYLQFNSKFVPWLSIIDVLMFNDKLIVREYLNNYKLL